MINLPPLTDDEKRFIARWLRGLSNREIIILYTTFMKIDERINAKRNKTLNKYSLN